MTSEINIIKAGYEILDFDANVAMKKIERAGRICYKSEDAITETSAPKFVANLINRGHEAMLEHYSFSVVFTNDRGVSHEEVRHRIASFAQESTRYVNYSKEKHGNKITVIDPTSCIEIDKNMREFDAEKKLKIISIWLKAMLSAQSSYMELTELGATPQFARSVLPNSTKTEIVVTANVREWRKIFSLRTEAVAHPQMVEVMMPLLKYLSEIAPVLFLDIYEKNVTTFKGKDGKEFDVLSSCKATMKNYES